MIVNKPKRNKKISKISKIIDIKYNSKIIDISHLKNLI